MNKFVLCVFVCISLFFIACGDDSNSAKPSLDESSSSIVKSSSSTTTKKSSSSSSAKSSSSLKASSSSKKVEQSSSSIQSSSSVMSGMVDPSTVVIDSMIDSRDGQTYKTVTIGSQTWMAQNLNYDSFASSCCHGIASNCTKYGRLYSWESAKIACPTGWHLPTKTEFKALFTAVGGRSVAGTKLKSTSGWNDAANGSDDYSFSALPPGCYRRGNGDCLYSRCANFWSSSENLNSYAFSMYLCDSADITYSSETFGYSVRCVKD